MNWYKKIQLKLNMAHFISSLSDLQNQYGGSYPISLSEYYHGGSYVNNNAIPDSGTISFSSYVDNGPTLSCTSNYGLGHTCYGTNNGFNIQLNMISDWMSNTVPIYEESFSNAYKYLYDYGFPIPNQISDGGNDMYDGGNKISLASTCIGGETNQPYIDIPYGDILAETTHGVFVASACNWPHLTIAYAQNDTLELTASGNTGSDGGGQVINIPVQQYSTSNNRYGSIWTCMNGLAGDPSIIDVWFSIGSSNWGTSFTYVADNRKTNDANNYSHNVTVGGTNIVLCKALIGLSNGAYTDAATMTSFVERLVYSMPITITESNVTINHHNDVCVVGGGDD